MPSIRPRSICRFLLFGAILVLPADLYGDAPGVAPFIKIRWPVSVSLAPDGTLYFIHNPDGLFQLYCRPASGGATIKLTDFADGMMGYDLSDDGKWIALTAAVGGNEQTGIYLIDTATRRMRALCCHPDIVYENPTWRRDSKAFAFRANDVSRSDFYVYVYDLAANTTQRVVEEKGSWTPADFSSNGNKLVVTKMTSATHTQLFEVDLASGKSREITPAGEQWTFEAVGYAPGDREFYVISDYRGDKSAFMSINLADGKLSHILKQYDDHEADAGRFNDDRSILAVNLNEDGYRTLHLHSVPSLKEMPAPKLPRGMIGNIFFQGDTMLFGMDNAQTPGVVYKWQPSKPETAPVAVTEADTQNIDVSAFSLPELVKYKSFDGLEVPAFLFLPPSYEKGKQVPFVIEYHGGPEGQTRPGFNKFYQYLLSRGYGVLAPNVRGSSGYGKKYLELDNYKKRMDSVRDGVAAAKWLVEQGYSTPKQIAAYGGSYGGFMVMATITEAPDAYGAACDVVGIVNMQTFLERTKDYRRKLREVEYGPLSDPEFLKSVSPIYKVERIGVPLLIGHGENDPRVPVHEARQLYDKMKELKKPVEMLVFPDEGHGFRKENNRIKFYETLADFLDRNLKKETSH